MDFTTKLAVVSGAAHGIGRAICMSLAGNGATVVGLDILAAELEETERIATEAGLDVRTAAVDITDARRVDAIIAEIEGDAGIQILVNCAGGVCGQVGIPLEEVTDADWDAILRVNLYGTFHLTRAVARGMKARRYGRIVNISSGAGRTVSLTGIQSYASAKAAQIGFTRQTAHELGPHGITVNCIAPGFVRSNPTTERQWQSYGPERQEAILGAIALRRLGKPEDIANAVCFLASDAGSWITGQTLSVYGGSIMQ